MKSKKLLKKSFKNKKSKSSKKIQKNKKKITKKIKKRNMIGGLKKFDATVSLNNPPVPNQYKVILSEKMITRTPPVSPVSPPSSPPATTRTPAPPLLTSEDA